MAANTAGPVDVIDFAPFLDGQIGFVYLVNHGMPQGKIDAMFHWSKRFFDLPTDVKLLAPHPPSGAHHRGYSAPGVEKVIHQVFDEAEITKQRASAADAKENFEVGRADDTRMPNIWLPEGVLPGFKAACLEFYWTCRETQLAVLRALAVGFRLPEDHFTSVHAAADNQLRLLHYPSIPARDLQDGRFTRIGAHSDFGSITLLLQDAVGGLEVEDPHCPGTFMHAQPVEGALMVNAGDFLQRWSNDTIRSTIHRVRAPPTLTDANGMTPERYSIPYFCSADFDTVVDCVPGTYSDGCPKKYEPISPLNYIVERLNANY